MINENTHSILVQGIKCCQFGSEEDICCSECPYLGYGCGEKLKEDLLYFLDFFSTVDGWAREIWMEEIANRDRLRRYVPEEIDK